MFSGSQQKLISYFSDAVRTRSLRQTYIIKGESGLGKKETLKKISEYIMCQSGEACGKCNSCLSLGSMANPDCVRVSNGDKKTIELFKIREMIREVYIRPIMGDVKLFIIENAHLMDAAPQNALLKVIEEPPQYAVFVLVCDNLSTILPTILSRAFVLELERWSDKDLRRVCPLSETDEYMYTYCLGNIGTLKSISADLEFKALRQGVIDSFQRLVMSDRAGEYEAIDYWLANKDRKDDLIDILIMFLRDIVMYKSNASAEIANTDKIKEIQTLSQRLTLKAAFDMLSLANDVPRILGKYGNFSVAVQTTLMQMKAKCK